MKNFVLFSKIIVFVLLAALFLSGCDTNEVVETENLKNSENIQETAQETMQVTSESTEAPINIDVQGMLEEAEEEASALQKKLTEDSSLKQSDMNVLSNDIYLIWDDLLNDLWAVLKDTLDEKTMNALLEEQRAWITMKEGEVKKAGDVYGGGSMAPLVSNQKGAELTRTRVYELAEYLGLEGSTE